MRRAPATVSGYTRRFWQGSPDHRGTPTHPGRVVTLVKQLDCLCQGVVFEVDDTLTAEVLAYLDERESGGYDRLKIQARLETGLTVDAWTWIAPKTNANFLGNAEPSAMVEQILKAKGQSGANRDYVLKLAMNLAELGIEDGHVQDLARWIREADT